MSKFKTTIDFLHCPTFVVLFDFCSVCSSDEWKMLSAKDRDKMGITFQQEGEFWYVQVLFFLLFASRFLKASHLQHEQIIVPFPSFRMSFDDFVDNFTNVDICHFVNTSFFSLRKTWCEGMANGAWTHGARGTTQDRCGGNECHRTFLQNPQVKQTNQKTKKELACKTRCTICCFGFREYLHAAIVRSFQYSFDITAVSDTMMVCLDQEDVSAGKETGSKHLEIGFSVWKVE